MAAYKTLALELIRAHPLVHYQLKAEKTLLQTVERQARSLKSRCEELQSILSQMRPGIDPESAAESALEIALQELDQRLKAGLPIEDQEPLSLDAAMAYILRKASPNG